MSELADELYNRYQNNELVDTVEYYEHHRETIKRQENTIRTIGVAYRRMYDGGVERVLSSLLNIWTKMKYKVVLFTDEEPDQRDYDYPGEVQRIIIPPAADMRGRLQRLEEEICAKKVDAFIQNAWQSESALWEMLLIKAHKIPFVVYVHGHFTAMYGTASEYAMISHRIFALCDKVIALSDMNERFYQSCRCNVTQIANPMTKELRETAPVYSEEGNHHILWIGRITAEKRLDDALRIFAEVKKTVPDVELDIVGNGDKTDESSARMLCKELHIEDSVFFHGYQTNVSEYYQNSAVMLMTSEKEGYPTVLLECKAHGRAVVMYSLPYLAVVKDGKGIRTAQIGDVNTMSARLCEILLNMQLRHKLENETRESFAELRNYDHIAKWNDIFAELSQEEKGISENQQDILMMNMMMETLRQGIRCRLEQSFEYQTGEKILRIPRKILHFIQQRDSE